MKSCESKNLANVSPSVESLYDLTGTIELCLLSRLVARGAAFCALVPGKQKLIKVSLLCPCAIVLDHNFIFNYFHCADCYILSRI